MGKWDKLASYLMNKSDVVCLSTGQLSEIVGPLSRQMYKRISYWDPYMGKLRLNPGSAAQKAGYTVTRFEWKTLDGNLILKSIRMERISR
jgi:hypothetical protein